MSWLRYVFGNLLEVKRLILATVWLGVTFIFWYFGFGTLLRVWVEFWILLGLMFGTIVLLPNFQDKESNRQDNNSSRI